MNVKKYVVPAMAGAAIGFLVGRKIGEAYAGILYTSESDIESVISIFEWGGTIVGAGSLTALVSKLSPSEDKEDTSYRRY